jgi:hypothetical protein
MIMLELQNNNAQFKDLFLSIFLVVQIQTRCRFVLYIYVYQISRHCHMCSIVCMFISCLCVKFYVLIPIYSLVIVVNPKTKRKFHIL